MSTQLVLLGLPKVTYSDQILTLRLTKPTLLLIYLASKGDWVSRSELAYLFHPDTDEVSALKHIRLSIYRAKQFAWASALEVDKYRTKFSVPTDLAQFRQAVQSQNWPEASKLYIHNFLGDYSHASSETFSTWLDSERLDLKTQYQDALQHYANDLEKQQNYSGASEVLSDLLKQEPSDELVFNAFVKNLYLAGHQGKALKAIDTFTALLKNEYDATPLEETQKLIHKIQMQAELETLPNTSVLTLTRTEEKVYNLPQQSTRFIGRQNELTNLVTQLASENCRLISLVGLGGIGKTRLALELATLEQHNFNDGVCFVALAAISPENRLINTIAQSLRLTLAPKEEPQEQVIQFLRYKNFLLVLDNFEHFHDAAPIVNKLLEGTIKLKIIVTTRIPLKLKPEWIFDVEGLQYERNPSQHYNENNPQFLKAVEQSDADRLFIEGMHRVNSKQLLSLENINTIKAISQKLEGLPLAIELASGWTRIMPPEKILSELTKNINLLESNTSDRPSRQRSMRTVLDETFQQLTATEQQTLIKLSVFHGGFDFQAAQKISNASYRLLLTLSNFSLLNIGLEGRFDLHEVVKEYLNEKLAETSYRQKLTHTHFQYFTQLAETLQPKKLELEQQDTLSIWIKEQANFIKALEWAFSFSDASVMSLLRHLSSFWLRKNLSMEIDTWLTKAHDSIASISQEDKAFLLTNLASAALLKGETMRAEQLISEALDLSYATNSQILIATNMLHFANLKIIRGVYEDAFEPLRNALEIGRRLKHDILKIAVLDRMAMLEDNAKRFESAINLRKQALELARELGARTEMQQLMSNLGVSYFYIQDYDRAERLWLECLSMHESGTSKSFGAGTLVNLGNIAEIKEDYIKAEKLMTQGLLICLERNYIFFFFNMSTDLARVWFKLGHYSKASELLGFAQSLKKQHNYAYSFSQEPKQLFIDLKEAFGDDMQISLVKGERMSVDEIKLLMNQ